MLLFYSHFQLFIGKISNQITPSERQKMCQILSKSKNKNGRTLNHWIQIDAYLTEQYMNQIFKIGIFAYLNSAILSFLYSKDLLVRVWFVSPVIQKKSTSTNLKQKLPNSYESPEKCTKWFMCCSVKQASIYKINSYERYQ